MISLNTFTPQTQPRKIFIKNSIKQLIYYRDNYRKRNITEEKSNPFAKPYSSLPKESSIVSTPIRLQPMTPFVRSKTQVSMAENLQKKKKPNYSPPKLSYLDSKQPKRKKIDPSLRLIAKSLVFRKSHKYYLYKKNKRNTQPISPEKPSSLILDQPKGNFFNEKQEQAKLESKLRKKYKLLELTGSKINLLDIINMQSFNNSNIYLQSNAESYCD